MNGSNILKMEELQGMMNEHAGRPLTSRSETLIAQVKSIISENCGFTVQEVAEEGGTSTQF
jgi:hypothetical protein